MFGYMQLLRTSLLLAILLITIAISSFPAARPMDQPGPSEPRSPDYSYQIFHPNQEDLPGPSHPVRAGLPPLPEVPEQSELVPFAKTDSDQAVHDIDIVIGFRRVAQYLPVRRVIPALNIAVSPLWSLNGVYFNRPGPHLLLLKQQLDVQKHIPRLILLGRTRDNVGMVFAMPVVKTDMIDAYVHKIKDDEFLWAIVTAFPLHSNKPWLYNSLILMQNVQSARLWTTLDLHERTVNIRQILARMGG